MRKLEGNQWELAAHRVFGEQNALLTAGDRQQYNTMTIGWGMVGQIWGHMACTVYVRPERYTYEFMERQEYFTVSILPRERRDIARLCGTKSGRDTDKAAACGLTVGFGLGDAPYVEEAELVLVCKKCYAQEMDGAFVTDGRDIDRFYGDMGNWHKMYIGKILEVYAAD